MSEKMEATKVNIVDSDLEWLIPKNRTIIIGDKKIEISELVAIQYTELTNIIIKIFMAIYNMSKESDSQDDSSLYQARVIDIIAKDIVPILVVITGMNEDEIKNKITALQIAYSAKVVWEMNAQQLIEQIKDIRNMIRSNIEMFEHMSDGIDDSAGTPLEE